VPANPYYADTMNPEITNETPKRRTLPEAAKPYRWKKGGPSPNPGGRPRTAHISAALRVALERGEAEQLATVLLALATGRKKGTGVQIAALREIADRTEGKPHQSVEVDANVRLGLAERLERAHKRWSEREQAQFLTQVIRSLRYLNGGTPSPFPAEAGEEPTTYSQFTTVCCSFVRMAEP
jgi:hypothetical protein